MAKENTKVLTQIEGQHRAAAELCARGYMPALLPERCYMCDALVLTPTGRNFGIEIKANRMRGAWWCKRPDSDSATHLWIFVVLEPSPRFFILTGAEVQAECDAYQAAAARKTTDQGFGAKQVDAYENAWHKLPA